MQEPPAILRVTVGAPVSTRDGEKIGKVKEIRGEAFKVETGLLQRDYWLGAGSIESAVPEAAVTLNVDKPDLDACKVEEPPQAA